MPDNDSLIELPVAKAFATICDLGIKQDSIIKRDPPYPDIYCADSKNNPLSFELVELIDNDFARNFNSQSKIVDASHDYLSKLKPDIKRSFVKKFHNADISFSFYEKATIIKILNSLEETFNLLIETTISEGSIEIAKPSLKQLFEDITVIRGGFNGPLFHVAVGGFVGNPVVERIKSKFKKTYEEDSPIHLLAFINHNPMFSENDWLPKAKKYVNTEKNSSQFEKIWFFDFHPKRIIWSG